jgi:hypothetical protein
MNVPKPTNVTRSPFLRAEETLAINASTIAVARVLLTPAEAAMRFVRSALFMDAP